jgi:hypothetical protein
MVLGARMQRLLLVAIAAASACRDADDAMFCSGGGAGPPGQGLNPLLSPTQQLCFDSAAACATSTDSEKPPSCIAVARPRWHCSLLRSTRATTDPLDGSALCYPSAALCELSRSPPDEYRQVGPCVPAAVVYCSSSEHAILCHATAAACALSGSLAAEVLGFPRSACVPHRTAE